MPKFIHISDLHIHGDRGHTNNIYCMKLVDYIIQAYQDEKPTILITGDIVHDGRREQYKAAVEILSPLIGNGFTLLPVPGNHDYGLRGNIYSEKSQKYFQHYMLGELLNYEKAIQSDAVMEDLYPMATLIGDILFIGIDSVVGAENLPAHFARGKVGKVQRKNLKILLHQHKDSSHIIVVYFHHHPFDRRYVMKMADAKKVLEILSGNVDFICFGHDHKSELYNGEYDVDWMLASGKSTDLNRGQRLQFREVVLEKEKTSVSLLSFVVPKSA